MTAVYSSAVTEFVTLPLRKKIKIKKRILLCLYVGLHLILNTNLPSYILHYIFINITEHLNK